MGRKLNGLSQRYVAALRQHLKQGPHADLQPAQGLGRRAMALGLETLDLAKFHERALITLVLPGYSPGTRAEMIRRAGKFFAEAITPIEETHRTAQEANAHLNQMVRTLNQRSIDLAASNRQLQKEIIQRKSVEESLRKSEQHYSQLLEQSHHMQEQLRLLSRQLLSAQEEERKMISRELHDQIAQTLTGHQCPAGYLENRGHAQQQGPPEKNLQHPKTGGKIGGHRASVCPGTAPVGVGRPGADSRPAFIHEKLCQAHGRACSFDGLCGGGTIGHGRAHGAFRVAQEALANVARHAQASRVEVSIQKLPDRICMKIKDDGKSFNVERALHAHDGKHLGLLGMRERLEMVGGKFIVESSPGKGSTIRAEIPIRQDQSGGGGQKNSLMNFAKPNLE